MAVELLKDVTPVNGNGTKLKAVATTLTGPLGAVAVAVWLLQWFMSSYQNEQQAMRETLKEVVKVTDELRRAVDDLKVQLLTK